LQVCELKCPALLNTARTPTLELQKCNLRVNIHYNSKTLFTYRSMSIMS